MSIATRKSPWRTGETNTKRPRQSISTTCVPNAKSSTPGCHAQIDLCDDGLMSVISASGMRFRLKAIVTVNVLPLTRYEVPKTNHNGMATVRATRPIWIAMRAKPASRNSNTNIAKPTKRNGRQRHRARRPSAERYVRIDRSFPVGESCVVGSSTKAIHRTHERPSSVAKRPARQIACVPSRRGRVLKPYPTHAVQASERTQSSVSAQARCLVSDPCCKES